ncbi:MAG: 5-formyltetrahydrofolate cyclo-ligase [Hespellia sp.]|nr:5-formyltetrahydrofolate cyclo-ligase [Hespellia sp.]
MILILAVLFFLLILLIGGERGAMSFIALCGNVVALAFAVLLITAGFPPLLITAVLAAAIHAITLVYQNGRNIKTFAAVISSGIMTLVLFLFVLLLSNRMHLSGLNEIDQQGDFPVYYSFHIHINMAQVAVSMIIIGLLGAVMDTSVAVASALYEVHRHSPSLKKKELFASGIVIGKDILATTLNTLYFAYIGESMMLLLYLQKYHYSFVSMMNSKAFLQEFTCIIVSAIGCMLIIPISAAVSAEMFEKKRVPEEQKKAVRQKIRQLSENLTDEYRKQADASIAEQLLELPEYQAANVVFCFASMPGEIDTSAIFADAFRRGKKVGVPKCISRGIMEVYEIKSLEDLEESGPYHIREPKGQSDGKSLEESGLILPEEIDFAVVPCVSCSGDGKRLGHGGGYYDRYLEKTRAYKAAVCRSKEMCADIPVDEHDLLMDVVISEKI